MELREVFPLIGPAMLLQISIQIYYIIHCRRNPKLTKEERNWFTLGIAVLNLPIAAVYLFYTREETMEKLVEKPDENVEPIVQHAIFVLLVLAYEIYALQILIGNRSDIQDMSLVWMLGACFVLLVMDELYLFRRFPRSNHFFSVVEIGLAFAISMLDKTGNATFFVIIVAAAVLNRFSIGMAKKYILVILISYLVMHTGKLFQSLPGAAVDMLIGEFYLRAIGMILILTAFYMLKKQILTTRHLSDALVIVQEQSRRLEEMSVLAERNRMAKEIHDTVGHRLTGALWSIEAAQKLEEPALREEKLQTAARQVKDALGDIRHSVRMIQESGKEDLIAVLEEMAIRIQKEMGLTLEMDIHIDSNLLPIQQNMITRALMECATNSVRHGKATQGDVLIQEYDSIVSFSYSDNGVGCSDPVYGFGLQAMETQIKSLGGSVHVESEAGEGFSVHFQMPIGNDMGGKHNA